MSDTPQPSDLDQALAANPSPPQVAPDKPKNYLVHFQQNRSFELGVGGTVYVFGPFGTLELPESVVTSPNFLNYKEMGFFSIQEVL